jgi:hypothetical protein
MIGWIMSSRKDVANAEAALKSDEQGVRDEVGFLNLHQAFADHFFPGTSVLHTRMRYVLFVPWLMAHSHGNATQFKKHELALTWQLKKGADASGGVIGGRSLPRTAAQSAAMIYWTALSRWNILQPRPDGAISSRGEVNKRIAAAHIHNPGMDDGEPWFDEDLSPFVQLPAPPFAFLKAEEPMNFMLTTQERVLLRRHLIGVGRPQVKGTAQSLLARLAEEELPHANVSNPWSPAIRNIADEEDRRMLMLASQTAALAGVGRAVYASLVEQARNTDGADIGRRHRDDLKKMVGQHRELAQELDIPELNAQFTGLPVYLSDVLTQTQHWLRSGRQQVASLRDVYQLAEIKRKGTRARLAATVAGRRRRAEWDADEHPLAEPLHFRWPNVRRLMTDLRKP